MDDTIKPRDRNDIEAAVQWALGGGKSLEVIGRGSKRALGRPAQHDATLDLSALSGRDALRASGAGAVGEGGHAACRDRCAAGRPGPGAGVRADGLRARARRARGPKHHRRRHRGQPVGAAAHQGGYGARPFSRRDRCFRARRDVQVGRPGGQERHRLRSVQAAGGLLGYIGDHDRRHAQGAAAAGDGGDARPVSASTSGRPARP